jgi:hypothetical protein
MYVCLACRAIVLMLVRPCGAAPPGRAMRPEPCDYMYMLARCAMRWPSCAHARRARDAPRGEARSAWPRIDLSKTAILFIEYQNEFTTKGDKLHDAVKGTMSERGCSRSPLRSLPRHVQRA